MTNVISINRLDDAAEPRSITGDFQLSPRTGIYNPGVRVVREGRRRFAVYAGEHRWGHFVRLLDAGTFAQDVRFGRAFESDVAAKLRVQPDAT